MAELERCSLSWMLILNAPLFPTDIFMKNYLLQACFQVFLIPPMYLDINVPIAFDHLRKGRGYFGQECTSSVNNVLLILFPFNG